MNRAIVLMLTAWVCLASQAFADYTVELRGTWPKDWPQEMEPLREQARTLEGPSDPFLHYAIKFKSREQFESLWPKILTVKSKGAPIVLRRGKSFWLSGAEQGVCIHTPPKGVKPVSAPKLDISRRETTNYIELIVDGKTVDLNRIALPPDTPIIDMRFKK